MNRAAVTSLVVFVLLVAVGWYLTNLQSSQEKSPTTPAPTGPAPAGSSDLGAVQIAPEGKMAGYSRDRFPHWASQGNSCDTREIVLQRQGAEVKSDKDCKAVSGTWNSVYDGVAIKDAGEVDIDHTVPLAEAWRSGADKWTDDERKAFANDLGGIQLIAVTAKSNRSKGDQDPAKWKPPVQTYWCTYAQHWISVKITYKLTADQPEHDALAVMLKAC
ncbi:HNH endonuclease family protein [Lentzea sp. BCCO 10_0856]|uniref:HNH endonuclease family protein n=1 Tax=Lentzea miocenica TaxID=3095431 RepID=A0ABU4T448_9PSEU|nr:HNH endonuclease family protein [Lentzea sp. BCCO 10_0856]MDX8032940.1 HNH endonuclease family protein [Lentzea sp. BCCO 10_0856]